MSSEFAGKDRKVLFSFNRRTDHSHLVAVVQYSFDDGSTEEYLEVVEVWPDGRKLEARHAVTEAVHVLANVGDAERFEIANRPTTHSDIQKLQADVERLDAEYETASARARRARLAEHCAFLAALALYTLNVIVRSVTLSVVALVMFAAYLVVLFVESRVAGARDAADTRVWRARDAFLLAAMGHASGGSSPSIYVYRDHSAGCWVATLRSGGPLRPSARGATPEAAKEALRVVMDARKDGAA